VERKDEDMPEIRVVTSRTHLTDERDGAGRSQELIIRATVVAPEHAQTNNPRIPLNLAIVIDRSGSMAGRKLADAVAATQRIVSRLGSEDRCTIVAFDTHVSVLADGNLVSEAQRDLIRHALTRLQVGGSTNLAGGWDTAVRILTGHHRPDACISRVIVLTDGNANIGVRDAHTLGKQAALYAHHGVSTSTYGLGRGYNEAVLLEMSRLGMGNHQFIEQSADIDGYFSQELQELFAVSLTSATVTATLPAGYLCEVVGGIAHHTEGVTTRIDIGSMVSLEQRHLYLRIVPLSMAAHGAQTLSLRFAGVDSGQQSRSVEATATWTLTDKIEAAKYPIQTDIEQEAMLIDLAHTRTEANRLTQEGRYDDARSYVRDRQMRSTVYEKFSLYERSAMDFERPFNDLISKRRLARTHMSTRFSTKDLAELKKNLADLIRDGGSAAEIEAAEYMIAVMKRLLGISS